MVISPEEGYLTSYVLEVGHLIHCPGPEALLFVVFISFGARCQETNRVCLLPVAIANTLIATFKAMTVPHARHSCLAPFALKFWACIIVVYLCRQRASNHTEMHGIAETDLWDNQTEQRLLNTFWFLHTHTRFDIIQKQGQNMDARSARFRSKPRIL